MRDKYIGKISLNKTITPPHIIKIYNTWRAQRQRCNNKKATSYKHWGAKGIKVEYSAREFIAWYLKNIKYFVGIDPVTSRLDHSKNYSFDNIKLESRAENSRDAMQRNPTSKYLIEISNKKTGKIIATVFGTEKAESITGINAGNISRYIRGIYKTSKRIKYDFKLLNNEVTY